MITPSTKITRTASATWREIDGQVVIVSIDVNRVRLLNRVGSHLWRLCDGRDVGALVSELCAAYAVPADVAQRDVEHFVDDLAARGMVDVGR